MIARMAAGTETGRLLVWRAAWLKNQGLRNTRETSLAKWHATEHAVQSALDAIQIHGANGYSNEFPVERYLRNSKAAVIYEGTSQLHTLIQADYALGYREDRAAALRALAGAGLAATRFVTARRLGRPYGVGAAAAGETPAASAVAGVPGWRGVRIRPRAVTMRATAKTITPPATSVRGSTGSLRMTPPRKTATTGLT